MLLFYADWIDGQPNDYGKNQDCVLTPWNDMKCSDKYAAICELNWHKVYTTKWLNAKNELKNSDQTQWVFDCEISKLRVVEFQREGYKIR